MAAVACLEFGGGFGLGQSLGLGLSLTDSKLQLDLGLPSVVSKLVAAALEIIPLAILARPTLRALLAVLVIEPPFLVMRPRVATFVVVVVAVVH